MGKFLNLSAVIVIAILLSAVAFAEETPDQQRDRENDFIKELSYRQREYQNQYVYLSEKESKAAAELNNEITTQNESPSAISLQRIDNLRAKLMENLQDQIKNDRDYIRYVEMRLSELVDYKFLTIKAVQKSDSDTLPAANAQPAVLDIASIPGASAREEPKRQRIPLTIDDSPRGSGPAQKSDPDLEKFKKAQEELDRLHDESLKPRIGQDY